MRMNDAASSHGITLPNLNQIYAISEVIILNNDYHKKKQYQRQGRRQGGAKGLQPLPHQKKRRERGERKGERKKKEKRGIKREGKLNQSFQEQVVMGPDPPAAP